MAPAEELLNPGTGSIHNLETSEAVALRHTGPMAMSADRLWTSRTSHVASSISLCTQRPVGQRASKLAIEVPTGSEAANQRSPPRSQHRFASLGGLQDLHLALKAKIVELQDSGIYAQLQHHVPWPADFLIGPWSG